MNNKDLKRIAEMDSKALSARKVELEQEIKNYEEILKTWQSTLGRLLLSATLKKMYAELNEVKKTIANKV